MKSKKNKALLKQQRKMIIAALIIPVLMLLVFTYYPLVNLLKMSVSEWNGISPKMKYVGLDNFKLIFSDAKYFQVLSHNLAYLAVLFIQIFLALYLAVVLNDKVRLKGTFKAIIVLPMILNGVAVSYIFSYLFNYNSSPLNALLALFGIEAIKFITPNYQVNWWLALVSMWKGTGYMMLIFYGALQTIPGDLYEAAKVDGSSFFQRFRYITFPSIRYIMYIQLILGINGCLQAYYDAYVITKGGPAGWSETYVTKVLNLAFEYRQFGPAAALSLVLLVIVVAVTLVVDRTLKERE